MIRHGIVGATVTLFAINLYENLLGNKKRLESRTQAAIKAIETLYDQQIEQNRLVTKRLIDQNLAEARIDLFSAHCVRAQTKLLSNYSSMAEVTFELEQMYTETRECLEAIIVDSDIVTDDILMALDSMYFESGAQLLDIQKELG